MEGHSVNSVLPAVIVFLPFAASLLVRPLGRRSESLRDWFSVVVTAITFLGSAALIPQIAEHHVIGYEIPLLIGHITFEVDSFGMFFALFTSFVWMASTLYASSYMQHEQKRDRYFTYNLAVLGANMGVVLAGDLISLYLFFEALGLLAYWLVVHTETREALAASTKYLWMTVMGGFALVAGILITFGLGSTGSLAPVPLTEGSEILMWTGAILMITGFGVKAGMVPVHVWLPDAHPVAPSPASALLSGVMIKAGAYGIFRVVTALFRPQVAEHLAEDLWHFTSQLGYVVLWIGIATMFIGVVLALLQENAKRMLAYHSISQMGFILAGIGCAGYLGAHGAMGFAGGLYHIVNHALFKACLFLGVGAVYFRTHELNMYKLGGLWKKMPFAFVFTLIAACGITGVPFFNGFVSKCLVHHSIVESIEHALHYYTVAQANSLRVAEIIYIVTCGGTACSFIKLISFVFLGKPKQDFSGIKDAPPRMLTAMAILAVPIVGLGLAPGLLLNGVFSDGLHTWGLHSDILEHFTLFTGENLLSVVYAFSIGFAVFFVGIKTGAFHAHFPAWFSIDYWYRKTAKGLMTSCKLTNRAYGAYMGVFSWVLAWTYRELARNSIRVQRSWKRLIVTLSTGAPGLRRQQFMDTAYVIIEKERHATVRHAVDVAIEVTGTYEHMDDDTRQRYVDAVRDTSMHMATRLFDERMGVIGELVRVGRIDPIRTALEVAMPHVERYREPVAKTALNLAEPRMRGENILRTLAHEMNAVMSEERFDLKMRAALPSWKTPHPAIQIERRISEIIPGQEVISAYRAGGLTRIESAGKWLANTGTALVEAVIQERVPWMIEERFDSERIVRTRLAIQRYVRDIGLNVGIAVGMWLLFIIVAATGAL